MHRGGEFSLGAGARRLAIADRVRSRTAADAAAKDDGVGTTVDAAFIRHSTRGWLPGLDGSRSTDRRCCRSVAPRPLLVINGDSDARTPLAGVEECLAATRPGSIRATGAEDRLKFIPEKDTAHCRSPQRPMDAALAWFKLWLKP